MQKKICTIIMITLMLSFQSQLRAEIITFSDVPESAWYYRVVHRMAANGMVFGIGDNKYNPEGMVTRGEFMALLIRIFKGSLE